MRIKSKSDASRKFSKKRQAKSRQKQKETAMQQIKKERGSYEISFRR